VNPPLDQLQWDVALCVAHPLFDLPAVYGAGDLLAINNFFCYEWIRPRTAALKFHD
jgi:hypothetical protein